MSDFMKKVSHSNQTDDRGATAIEYGLMTAAISIIIISSLRLVGVRLSATFATLSNTI